MPNQFEIKSAILIDHIHNPLLLNLIIILQIDHKACMDLAYIIKYL